MDPSQRSRHRRTRQDEPATEQPASGPATWPTAWLLTITGVVLGSIWPFIITLYIVAGVTGADPSTRGLLIAGVVAAPLGALNALSAVLLDRLCRKRVADVYATATGLGERIQALESQQADASAAQGRAMVRIEQVIRDAIVGRYQVEAAISATEEAVGRTAAVLEQVSARMDALDSAVAAGCRELAARVTAVEQRIGAQGGLYGARRAVGNGDDPTVKALAGIARWAAHVDRRLAQLQQPDQADGGADQPMELNDDQLRGYFLGLYDQERPSAEG